MLPASMMVAEAARVARGEAVQRFGLKPLARAGGKANGRGDSGLHGHRPGSGDQGPWTARRCQFGSLGRHRIKSRASPHRLRGIASETRISIRPRSIRPGSGISLATVVATGAIQHGEAGARAAAPPVAAYGPRHHGNGGGKGSPRIGNGRKWGLGDGII